MTSVANSPQATENPPAAGPTGRVLLVSYLFPPVGGGGVQRAAKFVKFLPRLGWDVSVLTVANPSVPLFDDSLLDNVAESTVICRAATWEPGYALKATVAGSAAPGPKSARWSPGAWLRSFARRLANLVLQPDAQILWKHNAVRSGMQLLRERRHDAILVTAPPFSSLLVGRALSRLSGLPLIVDFRDEWGLSNRYWENKRPDPLSRAIQSRMQKAVLRSATTVIATTQASAASLREECRAAGSPASVECIYNGYDPEDFGQAGAAAPDSAADGVVRLTYVGTLWTLTSIDPVVRALERLAESSLDISAAFRLVVAGRRTLPEQAPLDRLKRHGAMVEELGYVNHDAATSLMSSADVLIATLADLPGADRVLPAKVFEYMAVRRPILAIAPRGELWSILERCPQATCFEPGDIDGLAGHLRTLLPGQGAGTPPSVEPTSTAEFERSSQAGQLAAILTAAAHGHR